MEKMGKNNSKCDMIDIIQPLHMCYSKEPARWIIVGHRAQEIALIGCSFRHNQDNYN